MAEINRRWPTEDEDENINGLKAQLLEFWMSVICHYTGVRRYQSPLLSFCAMLGIKLSTKGWMEPGNFNSNLSGIIWVVQLLTFYDSARKEQQIAARRLPWSNDVAISFYPDDRGTDGRNLEVASATVQSVKGDRG